MSITPEYLEDKLRKEILATHLCTPSYGELIICLTQFATKLSTLHARDKPCIDEIGCLTLVLEIIDVSDTCPGAKFQALIVSPEFEGKALLQRHRLVNTALAEELKNIHAFQMKTLTPEQWEQQKQKQ